MLQWFYIQTIGRLLWWAARPDQPGDEPVTE
jgi:hypothetical protein